MMYQLGTKWKLWNLPTFLQADVELITLRGYNPEPPVILPADFYMLNVDSRGKFQGLSVEKITSGYCPTRRDLYLEKRRGIQRSQGYSTWGRIAGQLIEEYCVGLLKHFRTLAQRPTGLHYQKIQELSEEYSRTFWGKCSHKNKLKELKNKAINAEEEPDRLIFLLQQTAKYELTMLGVDYVFNQNAGGEYVPLMEGIPIVFDGRDIQLHPGTNLGLSENTTPDFIIFNPEVIVGDVKTGPHLQPLHLHTIAGYALAYESQYEEKVNFGMVYFFETHVKQMSFAQSYMFLIDDVLRRGFLDARDKAYKILQQIDFPPLADYEECCRYCKHIVDCYPQ